jgi:hypothetical protein
MRRRNAAQCPGQRRQRVVRAAALLLLALLLGACGNPTSQSPSATASSATSPATSSSVFPESPVDGVVIGVDQTSLVDVQSFTIRTGDGRQFEFKVGRLENATEFPPSHLAEHQADGSPVRVTFDIEGTELVATRLDDAP